MAIPNNPREKRNMTISPNLPKGLHDRSQLGSPQ